MCVVWAVRGSIGEEEQQQANDEMRGILVRVRRIRDRRRLEADVRSASGAEVVAKKTVAVCDLENEVASNTCKSRTTAAEAEPQRTAEWNSPPR